MCCFMKKRFYLPLALFSLFFLLFACSKSKESIKAKEGGSAPPKRIIAASVSAAYILNDLGNKNVIAVPSTKRQLPVPYSALEKIGHPENPNLEKIRILNPDIYISAAALKNRTAEAVENCGIKTVYLELNTYESCLNSILKLGKILNEEARADDVVKKIKTGAEKIISETRILKGTKVLLLMGMPPKMQAASKYSYAGSLLDALNLQNITDELYKTRQPYTLFSIEEIVKNQPEVILLLSHKADKETSSAAKKFFENDDIWKNIKAVKNGRLYVLDPFVFTVNKGLGILTAFETLKEIIYKDAGNGKAEKKINE